VVYLLPRHGGVDLRYNDYVKLETLNDGVNIYGNHNTTGDIRQGGATVINTSKQFVGTGGVSTSGSIYASQNINTPVDIGCRDLYVSTIYATSNVNTDAAYKMDGSDVISTAAKFVGTGGIDTIGVIKTTGQQWSGSDYHIAIERIHPNFPFGQEKLQGVNAVTFWYNYDGEHITITPAEFGEFAKHGGHLDWWNRDEPFGVYATSGIISERGLYVMSDRRLKKNVADLSQHSFDAFKRLRPVEFEWLDPAKESQGKRLGFIAQEINELYPEVIVRSNEPIDTNIYEKCMAKKGRTNDLLEMFVSDHRVECPFTVGEEIKLLCEGDGEKKIARTIKKIVFEENGSWISVDDDATIKKDNDGDWVYLVSRTVKYPMTVNYGELVPVLVQQIHHLNDRVANLEKIIRDQTKSM